MPRLGQCSFKSDAEAPITYAVIGLVLSATRVESGSGIWGTSEEDELEPWAIGSVADLGQLVPAVDQ